MFKKGLVLIALLVVLSSSKLEEGMFPLSDLGKVDFKKAGFKISQKDIYNPDGISLVNALVRVGGCTGSFVSDDGLIVTNHHCAFGAAAAASTTANDYIKNGFLAKAKGEEIRTTLTCRITASYMDVSARVLDGIDPKMAPTSRIALINSKIRAIVDEERQKNPEMEIEISEMFTGKSYTLFRYKMLRDIRMVYVPPRSIGEFGGESDNWVWPRHNGDFAFLRAYVAPDGSAREFHAGNVPYKPVKFLKVNPKGIAENDLVFVLGYPGRTFRHQPAQFVEYQQKYQLPYVSGHADWQIEELTRIGKTDYAKSILFSSKIKSLANVAKNYRGKIQGLERTGLADIKKKEEQEMMAMAAKDPALSGYKDAFTKINNIYYDMFSTANRDLWFDQLYQGPGLFYVSSFIAYHKKTYNSLTAAQKEEYFAPENIKKYKNALQQGYIVLDTLFDKNLMKKLLTDAVNLPANQKMAVISTTFSGKDSIKAINDFVDKAYAKTKLLNHRSIYLMLENNPKDLLKINEPMVELAGGLEIEYSKYIAARQQRQAELNALVPQLLEVKQKYKKNDFIPDANSTLRFTYGYVKGYSPADGEYNKPFTTLKGIIEKGKDSGDYYLPNFIEEIYMLADKTAFVAPFLKDVPVAFLYNMDTSGGNSGSPVMNSSGELVGVNFDRAYTATINDYAWNNEYSRSIGVDIRYVLYVLKNVAKADHLIEEMSAK